MATALDKRLVTRLSEDHLQAIAAWASDEGVDNATMVRMIIDRLAKGRAPLLSMMQGNRFPPALLPVEPKRPIFDFRAADADRDPDAPLPVTEDTLEAMLAQRLAELPAGAPVMAQAGPLPPTNGTHAVAAVSVRHVERTRYNPAG